MNITEENETMNYAIEIKPSGVFSVGSLKLLWDYRELLYFLVWRDIKVRYKQTLLGIFWIVLQPLVTIFVMNFIFGNLLNVPSSNVPYPLFLLSAILPWNYFANSLSKCVTSLVNNSQLLTKVFFPRIIIPISSVLSGLVDFLIAFVMLVIVMVVYQVQVSLTVLLLPLFLLLAAITALGFGLWLSALNVRYRDVTYLAPFLIQIWMYVTPVIYGTTLLPDQLQFLMAVNPMAGVVEGFRWALLGGMSAEIQPPSSLLLISTIFALVVLVSGYLYFRATERDFADIV